MTTSRFGSLDGLRALAILCVVAFHTARGYWGPGGIQLAVGVSIFFAISGFLITTLLLRERDRTGDIDLRAFYRRRSLRIFPLYYAMLIVYTLVVLTMEHGAPRAAFLHHLPAFATYTSDWFVRYDTHERVIFYFAWSLAVEEQFYLMWPSVEKHLRGAAPVALALLLSTVQPIILWSGTEYASMGRHMAASIAPSICLGVVLAHALHGSPIVRRTLSTPWLSPVFAALLVLTLTRFHETAWLTSAVITLFVGSCVASETHWLAPVLRWKPLASIGQVSYGIYMMHMLVTNVVERALPTVHYFVRFPIVVAITWGVAWVSFHTYEAWFLRRKARFQAASVAVEAVVAEAA